MVSRRRLPTVTFAVCALNEEANLANLLESVLVQKVEGFIFEKVLVVSDGSTDKTVEKARSFKSPILEIVAHKKRIGKSSRLNQIFAKTESDILVLADADVIFAKETVIKNLIVPIVKNSKVGMSGGHPIPMEAETLLEKAVNSTLEVYIPLRKRLKGGHNILSATGRIMALRKELYKQITVPKDTIANDGFTYFCCITKGFIYRYVRKAPVYFRSPQSLKDHISQNTRFAATIEWMSNFFPPELVRSEYHVPPVLLHQAMLKQFLKNPFLSLYIYLINRYCHIRAFFLKKKINAIWDIVYTTKRIKSANV